MKINNFVYAYGNKVNSYLNYDILFKIYLPLLSGNALKLFMHMFEESKKSISLQKSFSDLLNILSFSETEFSVARQNLEALNLLKTYENKESHIIFCLMNPLSFNDFVSDEMRKNVLINKIGNESFNDLLNSYQENKVSLEYENKSVSFNEFFDLNNQKTFDFDKLICELSHDTGFEIIFNDQVKEIINNYYLNNKFTFEAITDIVIKSIISVDGNLSVCEKELKHNFDQELKSNIIIKRNPTIFSNNVLEDDLNQAFSIYFSVKPEEFLSSISNNEVNEKEISIFNELRNKYCLSDEIINLMIDFSIEKTHYELNLKYLSKMARSFKISNIDSLQKAYEFLLNWNTKQSTKTAKTKIKDNKIKQEVKITYNDLSFFNNEIQNQSDKKINNQSMYKDTSIQTIDIPQQNAFNFEEEELVSLDWY